VGDGGWLWYVDSPDATPDDLPVAELGESSTTTRRAPMPRSRRVALVFLIVALAVAGVVGAHAATDASTANGAPRRISTTHGPAEPIDDGQARVNVLAALRATIASGSFDVHSRSSEASATATAPDTAAENHTIVADGVASADPPAQVVTWNVDGLSVVTARVNGTNVWEQSGSNFRRAPDATSRPDAPLSQFAGWLIGALGPREGAVATSAMASPIGYLDLAENAITSTSWLDDAVVDKVAVHEYQVEIDAAKTADRPGLTPEEFKALTAAVAGLRNQGYEWTTMRLAIDANGLIVRSQADTHFADGGAVSVDATYSDFGCWTVEMLPNGPAMVRNPTGCTAASVP